ncbi:PREDICTED: uncharacterized protein LOC109580717 [Amphimedon queenslandica]|uniref:Uncharacterized protein n=1 Tax=Amphimedon queenslandica TaxID=400682 RepID=A0A1X7VB18_AMPQE|nr:PREDICTED: uncharacterized protein LOC109580717 [Amphimedon queenslandica]|eukprot:XP_019849758.1 PREDICTED: uncharacterized protein LOC109580717 [Amphimedon queenslandica]
MKSFLFLVALMMCAIATAMAPIVMEKKPNHFKQYKVMSHGDLTDQNKDRKASIGSGWWTLGEKKQPKDTKGEPEDNEPGDVPDVWRPKPIVKRKIYNECYHPVSNQRIHHGSYSYHKESCLMCMCPFGRMKCEYAC